MTTALEILDKAAALLAADTALAAWVAANFAAPLTVKKGFIRVADVREDWFPAVIVAVGDEANNGDGQTWTLDLFLTCATGQADTKPDVAEMKILEISRQVADLFAAGVGFRMDGLAVSSTAARVATDEGSAIPKLFRTVQLKIIYER